MASKRQIAANRRNALKSTGPRSEAGKRRSSRNAYRHGFAAAFGRAGTFDPAIEALAQAIAVAAASSLLAASDPEVLAFARIAAHAERDLARIRSAKGASMTALLTAVGWQTTAVSPRAATDLVALRTEPMRTSVGELAALNRYERRTAARRDRAVLYIIAKNALLSASKKP